jgi:hypothetical protein
VDSALNRLWLNPFAVQRRILFTELSSDECRDHLNSKLQPYGWFRTPPAGSFSGHATSRGFAIHRVPKVRNTFLREARGRFERVPEGTRVLVAVSMNRFGEVVTAVLICAILYGFISAAVGLIVPSPDAKVGVVLGWAIILGVFTFVLAGPWNFEHVDEELELTQFLQKILNARRIDEHPPPME